MRRPYVWLVGVRFIVGARHASPDFEVERSLREIMNQSWTKYLPAALRAKVEGRAYLQNVISNTGWQFVDNILRLGLGLAVNILVTRYLGPEKFGLLSYAIAFIFIFSSLATMGLDWVVVRNLVRDPSRRDEILGTSFFLKLLAGMATFGLAIAVVFFLRPGDPSSQYLVGIIAAGAVFQAFGTINFWFQSQVQAKYPAYAKMAAFLLVSMVKIVLVYSQAPLEAFAWAGLAEVVLGSICLVVVYRVNGFYLKKWRFSMSMAALLLRDSWPLLLADIVVLAYYRIDQLMLGEIAGNAEVGIYSVAVLLAEAWGFIPMAIASSLFPAVISARENSEELFFAQLQKYYNLMAFLGYAVAIPVTVLATPVVKFLFGPSYSGAGIMLIGLIWAGVFTSLAIARSFYLIAMNWTEDSCHH